MCGSYSDGGNGDFTTFDVYCWQYQSNLLSQPSLAPDIISRFDELLTRLNSHGRYTSIILICHSQGGIIAKSYVLEMLANHRGQDLRIDRIITIGTPHRGPRLLWNILFSLIHLVKLIPGISTLIPFNQLGQLSCISRVIRRLRSRWDGNAISMLPVPPAPEKRHIRSVTMQKKTDLFVSLKSARGFTCDIPYPPTSGWHSVNELDLARILSELENHMYPQHVLDEIREIVSTETGIDAYVDAYAQPVSELIHQLRPHYDLEALERRTSEILMEFLEMFPKRPIRGLQWPEELFEFTRHRLGVFRA
jgi:hypothetical protein